MFYEPIYKSRDANTVIFFQFNQPENADDDITVTIAPGVTTGELSDFFTKNNVCLKSNVILDKVMYGGVIATGCHVRINEIT